MMKTHRLVVLLIIMMVVSTITIRAKEVTFTEEEMAYIEAHPVIVTAVDPEFVPYEFVDSDGLYKGMAADYLKLIEINTGFHFEILEDLTWAEAYDKALNDEIQLLPCIGVTEQRKEIFLMSDSYLNYQRIIMSRKDDIAYSFEDLDNYAVAVQRNGSHYSFLTGDLGIEPITYETLDELILALSYNEVDVAMANYASASYHIKQLGITNLKIDDVYKESITELAMAITNDDEMLRSIMNKALKMITEEEKVAIQNKWLGIEMDTGLSQEEIRNIAIGAAILVFIIGVVLYWSYTLKREIKRRQVVESALVEAKKEADKANDAKSMFLAHMSHEIRTPLNAISGLTYLLENTTISKIQKNYIGSLKDATYNLLNIINDILDFSKIEAGEVEIEVVPFSIDELLNKMSRLLAPKASEKMLAFHVKKGTDVPERLLGDPTRIEQVLINLVNNAIKFTNQGEVRVEVSIVSTVKDMCTVMFSVSDTGIGISEEQQRHMFVPFHQLDSSITRKYGGTGLGLSISKNIVSMLGGTIDLQSVEGLGSKFFFTLPLVMQSETIVDVKQTHPALQNIKAMVVDCDPVDRDIVGEYLSAYQIKRVLVDGYEQAITMIDDSYDLLITSIDLRGKSGIDLIEHGVNNYSIKAIAMAKQIFEKDYNHIESLGVKHVVMKPVISSILYDSIVQCFSKDIFGQMEQVATEQSKPELQGIRVLLVEDNEVNQIIEREILEQKGYEVTVANNGKEAVQFFENNGNVDIVLMDIHMPVMDGYEATILIKGMKPDIPIIAMTAVSFVNVKDKCEEVGMSGYVTKPVDPMDLFSTLEQFVKRDQAVGEVEPISMSLAGIFEQCDRYCFIDSKQGLARIGNKEELFVQLLSKYYTDINSSKEMVSKKIKNAEVEEAKKMIHKIKGSSGNIGATKLFQSAKTLNDVLGSKIEVDYGPYLSEFESDLENTLEVIQCVLSKVGVSTTDKVAKETNDEALEQLLERLEGCLESSDLDAFKMLERVEEAIGHSHEVTTRLRVLMDKYQFKQASDLLKEERQKLLEI